MAKESRAKVAMCIITIFPLYCSAFSEDNGKCGGSVSGDAPKGGSSSESS
jgi:hypothetical protein